MHDVMQVVIKLLERDCRKTHTKALQATVTFQSCAFPAYVEKTFPSSFKLL